MKYLKISKDISLPVDVVTQTIAILAKRRAGKSYTMRKICEELLASGQQLVMVDPKGDQWGIRSSADGKAAGFPIIILGGEHGDLPLEVSAGEVVAKLVVEEHVSILLDLSGFRKHEIATFMAIFLESVYRMKAQEKNRTPVMLVVDEADAIAPQKPQANEARMLGAIEDIVRRGGQRGIGCALITQRSAVLNKNVLTQAEILVVLRTIAPQDLKAMEAWIEVHGTLEQGKEMMESLPSLPIGDAWFWSPGWPTAAGLFKRTHILPITTFDSGATPKPGERKTTPKKAADVDLKALEKQMAATIEKAKAEDPKLLKQEIAKLKGELVAAGKKKETISPDSLRAATDASWDAATEAKNLQIQKILSGKAVTVRDEVLLPAGTYRELIAAIPGSIPLRSTQKELNRTAPPPVYVAKSVKIPKDFAVNPGAIIRLPKDPKPVQIGDRKIGQGELTVLGYIAQFREEGITREHITVLTGLKRSSRNTYLQRLLAAGYIRRERPENFFPTPEGLAALGPNYEPMPVSGPELVERIKKDLPPGELKILEICIEQNGAQIERDTLSELTGYSRSSRNSYIQRLSARQLIVVEGNLIRASDKLF